MHLEAVQLFDGTETWRVGAQTADKLRRHLRDMWPVPLSGDRFPGANPVSIERRHFQQLSRERYYVAEKSDGIRYLMYCTCFEGDAVTVLVDRRWQMFVVKADVPPTLSELGTVLDGELAANTQQKRSVFLVFDAVVVGGDSVHRSAFHHRMQAVTRALGTETGVGLPVHVKHFFALHKAWPEFLRHLQQASAAFRTDGVVLVPDAQGVRTGRHDSMFKCKPTQQNTVDLEVTGVDGVLYLAAFSRTKGLVPIDLLPVQSEKELALSGGEIVECAYKSERWHPLFVRDDKDKPNDVYTLERTLVNIEEGIDLTEFASIASRR